MGKLIAVVGNSGVGKTTLTRALCRRRLSWVAGLEQHAERPFQQLFAQDLRRYALANQIDYFLLRAEQEETIRRSSQAGIHDGGLDMDFQVFARHFLHKGYLSAAEFDLCARLYTLLRAHLPPPELVLYLYAPLEVVARRYGRRSRTLEIAALDDLAHLDLLVSRWVNTLKPARVISVDASDDDYCTEALIDVLLARIDGVLTF